VIGFTVTSWKVVVVHGSITLISKEISGAAEKPDCAARVIEFTSFTVKVPACVLKLETTLSCILFPATSVMAAPPAGIVQTFDSLTVS
jgi:hypothetical protein